jgi:diacylglycerol kinase family enzyme
MEALVGPMPIDRIAAYYNPNASHAPLAKDYIEHLRQERPYGLFVEVLETEPVQADMDASLRANVGQRTGVIVCSGDGATSMVMTASMNHPDHPAIATGPFGNACDMAHMLHLPIYLKNPETILQDGHIVQVRPLSVTPHLPEDYDQAKFPGLADEETFAFAYWATGITGRAAQKYSAEKYRDRLDSLEAHFLGHALRFAYETAIANHELHAKTSLTVTQGEDSRDMAEINISKGNRESKVVPFPLNFLDDEAIIVGINRPTIRSTVAALAKANYGHPQRLGRFDTYSFKVESDDDFVTQGDGQARPFPSGTSFDVRFADKTANVYATRLTKTEKVKQFQLARPRAIGIAALFS